jgi:peptidoglycan/LPS O-acetylase OafA/YrhL
VIVVTRAERSDIETLRGLAAVLMVMGHVIGNDASTGMAVTDDSPWRHFYAVFAPMRMPLFTVIAGYVYALRPLGSGRVGEYLRGRLRRLVLPLLFMYPLFLWIQHITPGAHQHDLPSLADCVVYPQAHFWFLYAMIWISLAIVPLERGGLLSEPRRLVACMVFFAALWLWSFETSKLALANAEHLMPFFIFGIFVQRFWDPQRSTGRTKLAIAVAVLALMVAYQLELAGIVHMSDPSHGGMTVALGFSAMAFAFAFRVVWPPLAWLGAYSYGIFLLHVYGTAGARIAMQRLGLESSLLMFVVGTVAGLALPVVLERLADRWPLARLLAFGRTKPLAAS